MHILKTELYTNSLDIKGCWMNFVSRSKRAPFYHSCRFFKATYKSPVFELFRDLYTQMKRKKVINFFSKGSTNEEVSAKKPSRVPMFVFRTEFPITSLSKRSSMHDE